VRAPIFTAPRLPEPKGEVTHSFLISMEFWAFEERACGWLGDWRREACIDEAFWPRGPGEEIAPFDKDTPLLELNCNSICLATNQVCLLYVEAGIRLSHKCRRAEWLSKKKNELSCCVEEWRSRGVITSAAIEWGLRVGPASMLVFRKEMHSKEHSKEAAPIWETLFCRDIS
jgi:hypothetical protein